MSYAIPLIDYRKIADAKDFYEARGYQEIPVPWIVAHDAYKATCPPDCRQFFTIDGYLNASGEQSFIELMLRGRKLGKHLCVTPCFRDEPVLDEMHHRYFFKLELIDTDATMKKLAVMIRDAQDYFDRYFPASLPTRTVQTDQEGRCFDIVDGTHGIELGSYGIRDFAGLRWIYGTGVALPRLDTVLRKKA